jgi:hypothetical protein
MFSPRQQNTPYAYDVPIELCRSTGMFRLSNNVKGIDKAWERIPRCLEYEEDVELDFDVLHKQNKRRASLSQAPDASDTEERVTVILLAAMCLVLL